MTELTGAFKKEFYAIKRFITVDRFYYLERLFKKLDCTMLLETRIGVKPINQMIKSEYLNDVVINSPKEIKIEQCLAGTPDFLKDEHTSIGKDIYEMPHYELIQFLDKGLPLADCSYIKRYQNGTLDFRRKGKISSEKLKRVYRNRLRAMAEGQEFALKVYSIDDNTYMVSDGKHSIAMAAYFNYPKLRFDVIPNPLFDTYYRWIFEKIASKQAYKKHHLFFKSTMEFRRKINSDFHGRFNSLKRTR